MVTEEIAPQSTPAQPSTRRPVIMGFLIWLLARVICLTLRTKFDNWDRIVELTKGGRGAIVVIWHGRSLICANHLRGRGYWALISYSRDGEVQNNIFRRFGFQTIRGSTGRGGARAALQLA